MPSLLRHGFADPVLASQRVFRAVMNALARPGRIEPLATDLGPPAPLTPELAAIALSLADHEAALWLDPPLAEAESVGAYLRFHTGCRLASDPSEAAFALISDPAACPPFESFALGSQEYPDRSATLLFAVTDLSDENGFVLRGPGILDSARLHAAPLPADMPERLDSNRARFPRGVDCIFAAPGRVAGLPRTTELVGGGACM